MTATIGGAAGTPLRVERSIYELGGPRAWGLPRAAPLLLLAVMCLSSCSYVAGGSEVFFSPDSSSAAYVCARLWVLPLPPEVPTIRSRVWIRWCRLERPKDYQEVEIGVFGRAWAGWDPVSRVHAVFSPDSRYLAVACPRKLRLIDCLSKVKRSLTSQNEVVTSLKWLDTGRLGYVSYVADTAKPKQGSLCFWEQRIAGDLEERTLIFSQEVSHGRWMEKGLNVVEWPRERWSPDGRFVLFSTDLVRGDLKLLDVRSRTASSISPRGYTFEGISWKGDGSAAACVGFRPSSPLVAFIIAPGTGEKRDFSDEFQRAFGSDSRVSAPRVSPLWTPDDKYLIVNDLQMGGCLVATEPWQLIPVGRLFIDQLSRDDSQKLAEDPHLKPPWATWQPTRGWVKIWVQFQEPGHRRGMDYLVDYSGRSLVPLGESSSPGGGWKITPDGKLAVKLEGADKLVIRALTLPSPDARP